jgi:nucleotide-binding universal stress UspA family protein
MASPPKNILCAVDFSEISIDALRYAIALARRAGGSVHVLHAWVPMVPVSAGAVDVDETLIDRIAADLERPLRELAAAHQDPRVVLTTEARIGDSASTIVSRAEARGADTIVVGTHGRSGLPRVILGSVAERVVRTATTPVVVVPPRRDGAAAFADRPLRTILCPVDFSVASDLALRAAIELAEASGARVTALHCYDPAGLEGTERATTEKALQHDLDASIHRYAERGAPLAALVRAGVPYAAIVDAVRELDADLVVMSTLGKSGLAHFLLGSVVERVIRSSPVPVMAIRPPAGR